MKRYSILLSLFAGISADELYAGYRLLTGPTPMLPKAAYGFHLADGGFDSLWADEPSAICLPTARTTDGNFTLFSDDGMTYAYEKGAGSVTRLHWDNQKQQLTHEGAAAWTGADTAIVEVAGHPRSSF